MIPESLKKATLEILILALLSKSDMYPYQMVLEINRSNPEYSLIAGVAYPVLYRLQDKGFISCRTEKVGERRTVNIYHMEPSGQEYLRDQSRMFFSVAELISRFMADEGGDTNGSK